jgi:hypothetical protein
MAFPLLYSSPHLSIAFVSCVEMVICLFHLLAHHYSLLPAAEVGDDIRGQADASVPASSATIFTRLLIVDPWHRRPQFPPEISQASAYVAVPIAPHLPGQLQIVATGEGDGGKSAVEGFSTVPFCP